MQEEGIAENLQGDANSGGEYSQQHVQMGHTSIVGHNNGVRPGGYVFVIGGSALNLVSSLIPRVSRPE